MFPPSSANALYVRALADALIACPVGETITYSQLTAVTGNPAQEHFHLVHRAMRLTNEETGAFFRNVPQVGYLRLANSLAASNGMRGLERMRRITVRENFILSNIVSKANDLSNAEALQIFSVQAQLGLIQHLTYARNMKQAPEGQPPPNVTQTVLESVKALREHLTNSRGSAP